MEVISINGAKVPASRCDPNDDNKGCDVQEIKYIEKIATFVDGDTTKLTNLL